MTDPCSIPGCVSQAALRRYGWFKWLTLGLLSLLLGILMLIHGWPSATPTVQAGAESGATTAALSTHAVILNTIQFGQFVPAVSGTGVTGAVNFAGTGAPGTRLQLLQDGTAFGDTRVDEAGAWLFNSIVSLVPGQHSFRAQSLDPNNTVLSQSSLMSVVIPNIRFLAQTTQVASTLESGRADQTHKEDDRGNVSEDRETTNRKTTRQAGESSSVAISQEGSDQQDTVSDHQTAESDQVVAERGRELPNPRRETLDQSPEVAGRTGTSNVSDGEQVAVKRDTQPGDPDQRIERHQVHSALVILGTNRDDTGNPLPGFFGRATPNTTIEILENGTVLGRIGVQVDGSWRCSCKLPPGDHTLMVREADRPSMTSQLKALTVPNLAPPIILPPVSSRRRAAGPVSCPETMPSGEIRGNLYVVGPCETMTYITDSLQTDLLTLMSYNPQIPDPNRIYAGQLLNIPATAIYGPDGAKG